MDHVPAGQDEPALARDTHTHRSMTPTGHTPPTSPSAYTTPAMSPMMSPIPFTTSQPLQLHITLSLECEIHMDPQPATHTTHNTRDTHVADTHMTDSHTYSDLYMNMYILDEDTQHTHNLNETQQNTHQFIGRAL